MSTKWCLKAAQQGCAFEVPRQLGYFYQDGVGGVAENLEEAAFWFLVSVQPSSHPFDDIYRRYGVKLTDQQKDTLGKRLEKWRSEKRIPSDEAGRDPATFELKKDLRETVFAHNNKSPCAGSPNELFALNVEGILCGGDSRGCQTTDSCGDLLALKCGRRLQPNPDDRKFPDVFYFINKKTKKLVNLCGQYRTGGCETSIPAEWTCGWPKDAPTAKDKFVPLGKPY